MLFSRACTYAPMHPFPCPFVPLFPLYPSILHLLALVSFCILLHPSYSSYSSALFGAMLHHAAPCCARCPPLPGRFPRQGAGGASPPVFPSEEGRGAAKNRQNEAARIFHTLRKNGGKFVPLFFFSLCAFALNHAARRPRLWRRAAEGASRKQPARWLTGRSARRGGSCSPSPTAFFLCIPYS